MQDEPYLPENGGKFVSEMATWPQIKYGHIFTYFISRPGELTQEQLLSWKQLDAFNYDRTGYVRTAFSMGFGHHGAKYVLLKAKVNPSQRSPDDANEAWIIAKRDGEIVSAHCTCMAG